MDNNLICMNELILKEFKASMINNLSNNNSGVNYTYLMTDGLDYKIGQSKTPLKRLKQLRTGNIKCTLICYGDGVSENFLHKKFKDKRLDGEWFKLTEEELKYTKKIICSKKDFHIVDNIIAEIPTEFEKQEFKDNFDKQTKDLEDYVIDFGVHKGRKLISMTSIDDISYCRWYLSERIKKIKQDEILESEDRYIMFRSWIKILDKNNCKLLHIVQKEEWDNIRKYRKI